MEFDTLKPIASNQWPLHSDTVSVASTAARSMSTSPESEPLKLSPKKKSKLADRLNISVTTGFRDFESTNITSPLCATNYER